MQHGIWGRYRERITCCIRSDGVGATRVTVRRLFRSSGQKRPSIGRVVASEWLYLFKCPVIELPLLRFPSRYRLKGEIFSFPVMYSLSLSFFLSHSFSLFETKDRIKKGTDIDWLCIPVFKIFVSFSIDVIYSNYK